MKWNDFLANVSKSFRCLRQEKDFFDVTLVSEYEAHISSHKVVLSASSDFFKNILRKCQQNNPMIYLSGVNSKELNYVMNYIYDGEVELYQEELDTFLNVAQKLKIDGLNNTNDGSEEEELKAENYNCDNDIKFSDSEDFAIPQHTKKKSEDVIRMPKNRYSSKEIAIASSNINVKEATDELVIKNGENFECRTCGKTAKKSSDIRRHVEIHIEGLSYDCNFCENSFRSRMSLNFHIRKHKK